MLRWVTLVAAALVLLLTVPASGQPTPPPPVIPHLPGEQSERFRVTVQGFQATSLDFMFDASPQVSCGFVGAGKLREVWQYARGKGVEIEFRKLGRGAVLVQRIGRSPGDTALGVPGTLERAASGTVRQTFPDGSCQAFNLRSSDCGQKFRVRSHLNLGWQAGRLTLVPSSTEGQRINPALGCGMAPIWNFDVFTSDYPTLNKQRGPLKSDRIFKSNADLRVDLHDHFLEPADAPPGYTSLSEGLSGRTTVTLERLGR